ncbi:MAG: hypothetical protein GY803_04100 [Chloroflexi bacterium]|nr:hypothetical protein [Chloroflexota bacterium]
MLELTPIALDPALGIDDETFIAAWNAHEEAKEVGRVDKRLVRHETFDPTAATLVLQTAVSIASSILASLILDIIRHKYPLKKEPEIIVIPQEDGAKIIVVKK